MANIVIDIASQFTGAKAFNKADSATDKLSKNVKSLAKTFGLAFSATAVLAYGKAAVKAAAADEKAQKQLALALKNVGLGRDAASSEAYIQSLQSEFGILDDKLRPAYQTLAVATKDTAEAQKLLNLSLDISASTGKDLNSVTSALSKAYLGSNTALSKLGVGISKADLKTKSFDKIVGELSTTFAGSAKASANTFQGSIDKLSVASADASEIIGKGLIDAIKMLGDQDSVDNLATAMQNAAIYTADVIRGIGILTGKLKELPGVSGFDVGMIPILGSYLQYLNQLGKTASAVASEKFAQGAPASLTGLAKYSIIQGKVNKLTAAELAALAKIRKEKSLALAISKANLALGKGNEVFDMDRIQLAAALANQTEQLGKATTSAQVLAIANDVARLNVKKSILALEDAIASGDQKAIEAATAKLNADLKILGTLQSQSVKLLDIKSILASLQPADLINQSNLDMALAKIKEMLALLAKAQGQSTAAVPTSGTSGSGIPIGDYVAPISMATGLAASTDALIEYADAAQARANAFADLLDLQYAADLAALQASGLLQTTGAAGGLQSFRASESAAMNITVNTGIGDPEAIARAIEEYLRSSRARGTSMVGGL